MKDFILNKWDTSRVYLVFLVVCDIIAINASSLVALLVRFNALTMMEVPVAYAEGAKSIWLINTVATLFIIFLCRLYNSIWRFASSKEVKFIFGACFASTIFNVTICYALNIHMFRSYFLIYSVCLFLCLMITRFAYRFLRSLYRKISKDREVKKVMIIGAGDAGNLLIGELNMSVKLDTKVCCIIDDDKHKHGTYLKGVRIVGGRDKILESVQKYDINQIIIAMPSVPKSVIREIIDICKDTECELKILPGVYQLVKGEVEVTELRDVKIEDLLGRDVVNINQKIVSDYITNKVVLVTGGGGSIGSELCRQIAANGPRKLIILDIYENTTYDIQRELNKDYPGLKLEVLIGSVRNEKRVEAIFEKYRPDIVYHAAAHKHVPLMEDSPGEAIKNNVFGTYAVCAAADKFGASKFVLISTDKAVNPTNIMGASKRICEMLIQYFNELSETEYVAVRFGNVLGSHGSVVPYFKKQIAAGGPVTVTHPDIIRYFMTIPEAVSLVLTAGANARGGEIFVLDMGEPVKILDLAKNMIKLSGAKGIDIVFTGLRPGEKLYEELLMDEEGLQNTDNELIHIGHPIAFDREEFRAQLRKLHDVANDEHSDVRKAVAEIVPTYKYSKRDSKSENENKIETFKDDDNIAM